MTSSFTDRTKFVEYKCRMLRTVPYTITFSSLALLGLFATSNSRSNDVFRNFVERIRVWILPVAHSIVNGTLTNPFWCSIKDTKNWDKLEVIDFKPKQQGDFDVDVKIQFCGVCGSDLHTASGGWGEPMLVCRIFPYPRRAGG